MAASRLSLHEQQETSFTEFEFIDAKDERYRALQDAKQARNLWSTWWKGHFRVGKVYASLNDHKKAMNSFQRAFALDPTKNEIQEALDESLIMVNRQSQQVYLDPKLSTKTIPEILNEQQQKFGIDPETVRREHRLMEELDPPRADVLKGHKYERGDIDIKQDYEQAAKYFAKAASQGSAEGMYNLARLTDRGLGVKKDHNLALKLLEQAAAQPPKHPICTWLPNAGVAEAEHDLGVRYYEGISVKKDLAVAANWFQRASNHGSALAANNLGSMYLDGLAVGKDLEKAEQLLELAARRGDPLAMLTLAELRLSKNDFQMAKIWHDRACESGNVVAQKNRDKFAKQLEEIQQCSSNKLERANVMKNLLLLQIKITASVVPDHSFIEDYNMLSEHANRGSITAKQLCAAVEHFAQALNILLHFETLTEEQENMFVHELSQCYRIEHIAAQIPSQMHKRVSKMVDRVLCRCTKESNSAASQLDEDVRVCYATLNINSYEVIDQFLGQCKQMYPNSIYFFLLSGAVNGFLRRPRDGLYNINCGLEIEPDNYELLYHKAVLLRHLGIDIDEAIKAYQTFIKVAPKDHRKVPEAYYEMAICYVNDCTPDVAIDWVKKLYKEGKEAEKLQLPCFLPYKSGNIAFIKPMVDINIEPAPVNNRKQRLTNPHRVELIKNHRVWEGDSLQEKHNPGYTTTSSTRKPRVKQQTAKSLIGLKSITLREIDPTKDQVYNGYVLSVTIIEESYSWIPSIHLIIEDENFDCERMLVYNIPEGQGEYLISKLYTIGSKLHIINPYLRIGAIDMKPSIRIDDISSILMQNKSEWILNMCRYCCEANARKACGKCQKALYCSKECQINDWKLYQHKLICNNN
jgi:TPR repeat protein/DNA-binding SARP family transcriptional activator